MSKFNVGDRVKIREWEDMAKEYRTKCTYFISFIKTEPVFIDDMEKYCGKTMTIYEVCSDGEYVAYRFEDIPYFFPEESLLSTNQTIVIYRDKNKTIALDKSSGKKVVAKCSPEDEFDFYTGAEIALGRLTSGCDKFIPDNLKSNKVREVRRKAKVGEYIKIVKPFLADFLYKKGDIMKVEKIEHDFIHCKNTDMYIIEPEYVVLENYEPKEDKISDEEIHITRSLLDECKKLTKEMGLPNDCMELVLQKILIETVLKNAKGEDK